MITRDLIVETARAWLRTPYHHQVSVRGAGCDCLGLVRGVWRDLYGSEPEIAPPYTPDWGEAGGREVLLEAADRHLTLLARADAGPGDVVIFRMQRQAIAKHAAILSFEGKMIHAQSGDRVREVNVGAWARRAVAFYAFPGRG